MKLRNHIYIALTVALSLSLTNCVTDDDLYQVDPNVGTTESFWKTDADALKGA